MHAGKKRIHPEIVAHLAEHLSDEGLTAREVEVLRAIAGGNRNRDIAEKLFISEETVKVHVKHVMEKLGARTAPACGRHPSPAGHHPAVAASLVGGRGKRFHLVMCPVAAIPILPPCLFQGWIRLPDVRRCGRLRVTVSAPRWYAPPGAGVFLADASAALDASIDYDETLASTVRASADAPRPGG